MQRVRYPLIEYTDENGIHLVYDNKTIGSFNICLVAAFHNFRNRVDCVNLKRDNWAHLQWECIEFEDFSDNQESIHNSLFICGDNSIYTIDGLLYCQLNPNYTLRDTWSEFVAYYDEDSRPIIFKFVEVDTLYNVFLFAKQRRSKERIQYESPIWGIITDVLEYDEFEHDIVDINIIASFEHPTQVILIALDSFGKEWPIYLTERVSLEFLSLTSCQIREALLKIKDQFFVIRLESGEYYFALKSEPILTQVEAQYKQVDEFHYLQIGSPYVCFDLDQGLFTPIPGLEDIIEKEERKQKRYYCHDHYRDWSNYWNID